MFSPWFNCINYISKSLISDSIRVLRSCQSQSFSHWPVYSVLIGYDIFNSGALRSTPVLLLAVLSRSDWLRNSKFRSNRERTNQSQSQKIPVGSSFSIPSKPRILWSNPKSKNFKLKSNTNIHQGYHKPYQKFISA